MLKNFSEFWDTLEVPLINCEINLMLTWLADFVVCKPDRAITFAIADTKTYILVVALSTQNNTKLLE